MTGSAESGALGDERRRRFATAVVARDLLGQVVRILREARIDVMPLKGVVLHALVYSDPVDRPLVDVDVAVRSADHVGSLRALRAAGFRVLREEPGSYETVLFSPHSSIPVDLHRRFSAARRHRLVPDAMFARGRLDETVFGFPLILPDPYDLYCHLLAHSTLDYLVVGRSHNPEDLPLLVRKLDLEPARCARRLEEHGLGRLARFALTASSADSLFDRDLLASLAPDPIGHLLSRFALVAAATQATGSVVRRAAALLLNPTLAESGLALAEAALSRVLRRGASS